MPKVALTEKQKHQNKVNEIMDKVAEGLRGYQDRNGMTMVSAGQALGVSCTTISKLIKRKPVQLYPDQFFSILKASGFKVSKAGIESEGST